MQAETAPGVPTPRDDGYSRCARCVMDTTVPNITFDEEGVCSHCAAYLLRRERLLAQTTRPGVLDAKLAQIKRDGAGNAYDCVVGISGGVDSTYVTYLVKEFGLRPLVVHVDNGWNSELAVSNIERTCKHLGVDLYTYVIDWEEFRNLQCSFLRASVSDAELPSDHANRAVLRQLAKQEGIKYNISGRNIHTEGMIPWGWTYSTLDWRYIRGVHERFSKTKLRSYPHVGLSKFVYSVMVDQIENVDILNFVEYDQERAMDVLQNKLGWEYYGGKHYESVYTRFFQSHILPTKFGYDKRKPHHSVLICTGQMTRDDALADLQRPPYPPELVEQDKSYALKKLFLTETEFEEMMRRPVRTYRDYPNNARFFLLSENAWLVKVVKLLKKARLLPDGFAKMALEENSTRDGHEPALDSEQARSR